MSGATGTVVDGKDGPSAGHTSANSRRFEAFKAAVSASFLGVFTALSKKVCPVVLVSLAWRWPAHPPPFAPSPAAHRLPKPHSRRTRCYLHPDASLRLFLGERGCGCCFRCPTPIRMLFTPASCPHSSQSAGYAWSSTVLPAQVLTGIFTTSGYVAWVSDSVVSAPLTRRNDNPTSISTPPYLAAVPHCLCRRRQLHSLHVVSILPRRALRLNEALAICVATEGAAVARWPRFFGSLHPSLLPHPERLLLLAGGEPWRTTRGVP